MREQKRPPGACDPATASKTTHPDHSILFLIPRREAELLRSELGMGGVAGAFAEQYLTRLRGRRATLGELARAMRLLRRDWGRQ